MNTDIYIYVLGVEDDGYDTWPSASTVQYVCPQLCNGQLYLIYFIFAVFYCSCTCTMQRKSHLCILRKWIARPQSQFPHSCVCEQFTVYMYSQTGSVCLFCCRKIYRPILWIYKSLTDTWMWKLGLRRRKNRFQGIDSSSLCSLESGTTTLFLQYSVPNSQIFLYSRVNRLPFSKDWK